MVNYRRTLVMGGTYFFTVVLRNRRADTLVSHVDMLRDALRQTRLRRPFHIDAFVVLPEHLHAIWTLPADDADYSGRWRMCKSLFVRHLPRRGWAADARRIWQPRFWEHLIRDEADFAKHVDYIHYNPVKHGHVGRVADWPWSSFHRFVRDGRLPMDWACAGEPAGRLGE
ncbi:transposase [Dyella sp. AtDHG13]|uniref:REP-associated tyrosine transposase n=1 Tax=Dyella sp. AtDHG13 TaxID=1938897 RepID=UPI0009459120|nr:transposase [Dyella sp. AtDHG13]